jgi:hypothetical protein
MPLNIDLQASDNAPKLLRSRRRQHSSCSNSTALEQSQMLGHERSAFERGTERSLNIELGIVLLIQIGRTHGEFF